MCVHDVADNGPESYARHVIGCRFTRDPLVQDALGDVASNVC